MSPTRARAALALSLSVNFAACAPGVQGPPEIFAVLLALASGSPLAARLVPGLPVDLDGDGRSDGTAVDTTGDGAADGLDTNGDGAPDLVLLDTNGDGVADAIDQNGDGAADYWLCFEEGVWRIKTAPACSGNNAGLIDTNGDGIADGLDTDGDGSINDNTLGQIQADTTAPGIAVNIPGGTYGGAQTVTLTCSDNLAPGTIGYTVNGAAPDFSGSGTFAPPPSTSMTVGGAGDGTYTLRAICRDARGNLSTLLTAVYVRDSNVPTITVTTAPANFISASGGAINATAIEWQSNFNGPYDVRRNSTTCGGGTSIASGTATANVDVTTNINATTHFSGEGAQSFTICATNAGNGLTGSHVFQVTRDDTAPTVTPAPATGNYSSIQSVTLACSDAGAGCDKIAYTQAAGSTPADPTISGTTGAIGTGTQYSTALSAGDDAVTTTKARARDNAGNLSAVVTRVHTISTGVSNITINSTTTPVSAGNASVDWESSRAGSYAVRIGGSDCSTGSAATGTNVSGSVAAAGAVTTTINNAALSGGSNTIRVCVENLLGNFGSSSTSVVKDTTNPTTSIDSPTTAGPHATGTTVSISCDDASGSGCKRIAYSTDGATPAFSGGSACTVAAGVQYTGTPTLPDGAYTIRAAACDTAGNVSSVVTLAVTVGPPSTPTISSATAGNGQVSIAFSAISGATSYRVYYKSSTGVTTADSFATGTSSPIVVSSLANGTTYYFRLAAIHAGGESGLSGESSATPVAGRWFFVTSSAYNGNLGGLAGANAKCNSDAARPDTSKTYIAYVSGNSLAANTTYVNASGAALGTTNGSGTLGTPLTNSVATTSLAVWVGIGGGDACSTGGGDWTCTSSCFPFSGSGGQGLADQTGNTFRFSTNAVCTATARLYCFATTD
jgi:Chitobiase/beta-hexosaminidase C-terminal domain